MSAQSRPISTPSFAPWKALESLTGLDRHGNAASRPGKNSWLRTLKKEGYKSRAAEICHAWVIRLCWLRALEGWLVACHGGDAHFEFLDESHLPNLAAVQELLTWLPQPVEERPATFTNRFPLLPALPLPRWFSQPEMIELPLGDVLVVLGKFDPKSLAAFGRDPESPEGALTTTSLTDTQRLLVQVEARDGSLLAAELTCRLSDRTLPEAYRIQAGPGGYQRTLPDDQRQREQNWQHLQACARSLFAVAPDAAAADRVLYHLQSACIPFLTFGTKAPHDQVGELPAFHDQIRIGRPAACRLDLRAPLKTLLPGQSARLGMWRTALKRFHQANNDTDRSTFRTILQDLPRHFKVPLRPRDPAYLRLQKLLKARQSQHTLLQQATEASLQQIDQLIEETRRKLASHNQQAFEWRYAFPESLNPETGAFSGFDHMILHLPEASIFSDPYGLLASLHMAYRVVQPGGSLNLWLPDNFFRLPQYAFVADWLKKMGTIVWQEFVPGERFEAMITGKLVVCWQKADPA